MTHKQAFVCWWTQALEALQKAPELADVAALALERGEGLLASPDLMASMVRAVCGQQVSSAAAKAMSSKVLQAAGCGIAMKNADPEVKESADYITRFDNEHDGLADAIELLILNGG